MDYDMDTMDRLLNRAAILRCRHYTDLPDSLRIRRSRRHRHRLPHYGTCCSDVRINWDSTIELFVVRVGDGRFVLTNTTMIVQLIYSIDRLDCSRSSLEGRVMDVVEMWNTFPGEGNGVGSSRNNVTLTFS